MVRGNGYHKEDLRGDLIKAGLAYVEKNGHVSLSVRTLAQTVGVSPGAPYHHFPDRRSLLLALAVEGFEQLMRRAKVISESTETGGSKLTSLGMSFIEFTTTHPRLAELMYESELTTPEPDPKLQEFQSVGQKIIRGAIASELPKASADEVEIRAVAFWSAIYGFAALRRKQNIPFFAFDMKPDKVIQSVVSQAATIAASTT